MPVITERSVNLFITKMSVNFVHVITERSVNFVHVITERSVSFVHIITERSVSFVHAITERNINFVHIVTEMSLNFALFSYLYFYTQLSVLVLGQSKQLQCLATQSL